MTLNGVVCAKVYESEHRKRYAKTILKPLFSCNILLILCLFELAFSSCNFVVEVGGAGEVEGGAGLILWVGGDGTVLVVVPVVRVVEVVVFFLQYDTCSIPNWGYKNALESFPIRL